MGVALVTDSTACLPPDLVEGAGASLLVVPLGVGIDGESFVEGIDVDSAAVAQAQAQGRTVTTSRPAPARLLEVYETLRAQGADAIVSVHCSSGLSSTVSSAHLAAAEASLPVTVIDSTTLGMAMGFAVMAGVRQAEEQAEQSVVADVVRRAARSTVTTFYVDSLDPLRRGGRIGRAGALLGSALSIKPLLTVREGVIEPVERVRTTSRAMGRLARRTVEAVEAGGGVGLEPRLAVHSLERADLAEQVTADVRAALTVSDPSIVQAPLGAVVTAHVGAGTVATVVAFVPV